MSYLKGKDLLHKGHTLECWDNSIPKTIIYKTNKVESIEAGGVLNIGDEIGVIIYNGKKPKEFDTW